MRKVMAGPEGVFEPGMVVDLPEDEALRLVAAGGAEALDRPVETAAIDAGDRAIRPAPRTRKA